MLGTTVEFLKEDILGLLKKMHSLGEGLFWDSCIRLSVICKTGSHAIQLHLLTVMSLRGNWFTSMNEDALTEAVQHFLFLLIAAIIYFNQLLVSADT